MKSVKRASYEFLGDLPWDPSILRKCYFTNHQKTLEETENHPGASTYNDLNSLRLSLEIFLDATADLIASVNRFKTESASATFWNRPYRPFADKLEIAIQRGMVSSAMCAMALVDHSRNFSKRHAIPAYEKRVRLHFGNNEEHQFVQCLRNYVGHWRMSKANWQIIHAKAGRNVFFFLNQDEMLQWDQWNSLASAYINKSTPGINVELLFEKYSKKVHEFHDWLRAEVMNRYGNEISEYLRYKRLLYGYSAESHWKVLIQQVFIPQKIDPYLYLDRYLTNSELQEVLSLPHRSKEQVDRIIAVVDEYNVCKGELRSLVYQLFNVS